MGKFAALVTGVDVNAKVSGCMSRWFSGFGKMTKIDLTGLDSSGVTSMSGLFSACSSVTDIDLSCLNTGLVTDMSYIFSGCSSLGSVNLCGVKLVNDINMNAIFEGCVSLMNIEVIDKNQSATQLQNKNIAYIGDSRTWYDGRPYTVNCKPELIGTICHGFQTTVSAITGCNNVTYGYNGKTSPQILTEIMKTDFSNIDAVVLDGGVADYVIGGLVLGNTTTYDPATISGAWFGIIEYFLTYYPNIKLIVNTEYPCWDKKGEMPKSFPDIKHDIASLYMLPCLDLYNISGLNLGNRDELYCDDVVRTSWRLHLNEAGNKRVGELIAAALLQLFS